MWKLSRAAWERFLTDGDEAALLSSFQHQDMAAKIDTAYPELHRLRDVCLEGAAYRVCRLVEPETGSEQLLIEPTEVPDYEHEGVPYRLQGYPLLAWVADEMEHPAKDAVDWDVYLSDIGRKESE